MRLCTLEIPWLVAMQSGKTLALQCSFLFVRCRSASYRSTWPELARINASYQSSLGAGAGAAPEAGISLVATRCLGVLHVVRLLSAVLFNLSTNLVNCFPIMLYSAAYKLDEKIVRWIVTRGHAVSDRKLHYRQHSISIIGDFDDTGGEEDVGLVQWQSTSTQLSPKASPKILRDLLRSVGRS